MKIYLSVLALVTLFNNQCKKTKMEIPSCIQQKIANIIALPKWNPAAEVNEYLYKDQHVYLFSGNCCDQYLLLNDGNCNYLCAPAGGITGKGDGKCADFYQTAKLIRLVWKDRR